MRGARILLGLVVVASIAGSISANVAMAGQAG